MEARKRKVLVYVTSGLMITTALFGSVLLGVLKQNPHHTTTHIPGDDSVNRNTTNISHNCSLKKDFRIGFSHLVTAWQRQGIC